MVEEHPVVLAAVADVGLQDQQPPVGSQHPVGFVQRRQDGLPRHVLEEVADEDPVDRTVRQHRDRVARTDVRLDAGRRAAYDVGVEVDGDATSGGDVVDELAVPRGDVQHRRPGGHPAREVLVAEHLPQIRPRRLDVLEAVLVQTPQVRPWVNWPLVHRASVGDTPRQE